jgi:hypothetical protein
MNSTQQKAIDAADREAEKAQLRLRRHLEVAVERIQQTARTPREHVQRMERIEEAYGKASHAIASAHAAEVRMLLGGTPFG